MEPAKILVVDDRREWLSTIELILAGRYDLGLASSQSAAWELARETSFELAILDQRLPPGPSGVELLATLRQIHPFLPGIILTEYADVEDAESSMRGGASYYLSKGRRDLAEALRARVASALAERVDPIAALIQLGESETLELKSAARWDVKLSRASKEIEAVIVKTVAAFLNSHAGGVLLIGVDEKGEVCGLLPDYQTLRRRDRDGFETFLKNLVLDAYGKDVDPFIHVFFHRLEDKEVCRVVVEPCARPIYVDDDKFYLRTGNASSRLTTRETMEYLKTRWK